MVCVVTARKLGSISEAHTPAQLATELSELKETAAKQAVEMMAMKEMLGRVLESVQSAA
jgi:hypothetical protein